MSGQPSLTSRNTRIINGASYRQQRQNAVGCGGSVASKAFAVVSGLIRVKFGGGKKEAAIGLIGVLWVEILTAFEEYPRLFEGAIGGGNAGGAESLKYVSRHR